MNQTLTRMLEKDMEMVPLWFTEVFLDTEEDYANTARIGHLQTALEALQGMAEAYALQQVVDHENIYTVQIVKYLTRDSEFGDKIALNSLYNQCGETVRWRIHASNVNWLCVWGSMTRLRNSQSLRS